MQRRDFVRAVISASFAPKLLISQQEANPAPPLPAPVAWTQGLNPETPVPPTVLATAVAESEAHFFSQQQMETLTRFSDLLMPAVGPNPGALRAQTPLFLDFLIGGSPEPRKEMYTAGLDWLETEAHRKFSQPFSKLDDAQAGTILKPWLRTWMSDHPPAEAHARFINIAHDDIRHATVNSKAWSEAQSAKTEVSSAIGLYWLPIEPDINGPEAERSAVPAHVRALPKAGHPLPVYPR